MKARKIGEVEVAPIGLGGMPMSLSGRPSAEDSLRVIHASLDAGVTFIDTADVYCIDDKDIGHNEELIRRALSTWAGGQQILVATKGGLERPRGAWTRNARPEHLRKACEHSLRSLGVDRIALYQLHAPDPRVPFAESVGALVDLRKAGKIDAIGLSNVTVDEIDVARSLTPIVSVQNRLSPFERHDLGSGGVVGHCERHGIAYLAYSPVGGGHGKGRVADSTPLNAVGQRRGVSPFQVALAWLSAKSEAIIPIPGASKVASAVDSAGAMDLVLDAEDIALLINPFPCRGDSRDSATYVAPVEENVIVRWSADERRMDEWSLVLASAGIDHHIASGPEGWRIAVAPLRAPEAATALDAYEAERLAPAPTAPDYGTSQVGWATALVVAIFYLVTGPADFGTRGFERGSAISERILHGEPWRAVTALTLHADLSHILGNAAAAVILVSAVSRLVGPALAVWLTLLSGAIGNWLTAVVHPLHHISVGASTATFGAMGALTALQIARARSGRVRHPGWIVVAAGLALLATLGLGERADVLAHVLGFGTGMVLGLVTRLFLRRPPARTLAQPLLALSALAAVVACWSLALGPIGK